MATPTPEPTTRRRALPSRRAVLTVGALGTVAGLLSACATPTLAYSLGTAEDRGFFSEFGALLASAVAAARPGFTLAPRATGGSVDNIDQLRAGQLKLGLALADAAMDYPGPLALGRVYLNYIQVAVPESSNVRAFQDLRGRVVSLGSSSGTAHAGERILEAAGMTPADVRIRTVPVVDALARLEDGTIEAVLFAGGVPHPAMSPASGQQRIRLLDLSPELDALQSRYGGVYERAVVPPGIYSVPHETTTVGVASLLLAHASLPHEVASGVVDVLIGHAGELIPSGTLGIQYLDARSLTYTFGVPLHPGAADAYRRHHG